MWYRDVMPTVCFALHSHMVCLVRIHLRVTTTAAYFLRKEMDRSGSSPNDDFVGGHIENLEVPVYMLLLM